MYSVFFSTFIFGLVLLFPCTALCSSNQFACSNGNCVPSTYQCDRYNDCADNSDEVGCGMLPTCSCMIDFSYDIEQFFM